MEKWKSKIRIPTFPRPRQPAAQGKKAVYTKTLTRPPKSPFLWPPRQRPTLQQRNICEHFADEQRTYWEKKLSDA